MHSVDLETDELPPSTNQTYNALNSSLAIPQISAQTVALNDSKNSPSPHVVVQSDSINVANFDIAAATTQDTEEHYYDVSYDLFDRSHKTMIPIFFLLAFFVYFDRGTLSAALDSIQIQLFSDSSLQSGALASAYLFGFCLTSPVFAIMGSYYPPLKMASIGMGVWCVGCACTGLFSNFYLLILARLLTGIGEASFLAFAATIIDTIAPNETRGRWLGFFYTAIPLGYAFGDGIGGTITDVHIYYAHGHNESWRTTFIVEAILVVPMIIFTYTIKSPSSMLMIKEVKIKHHHNLQKSEIIEIESDDHWTIKLKRVLTNPSFLLITGGYATQTFVTGTFSVEVIAYFQTVYNLSAAESGIIFGLITLFTGLSGSVFGGYFLDKLKQRENRTVNVSMNTTGEIKDYYFVKPCIIVLTSVTFCTIPVVAIVFSIHNVVVCFLCVGIAEFFVFASQGPVNNAILWCSLYKDRPLATSLTTFCIHLFGDACAPFIIGIIIDAKKKTTSASNAYNFALSVSIYYIVASTLCFYLTRYTLSRLHKTMKFHGA